MRFLLDENVDIRLVPHLESMGHDVTAFARDHPRSLADADVLEIAFSERRVLITNDVDFGTLVFRQGLRHAGVILFRLSTEAIEAKRERLNFVLKRFSTGIDDFVTVSDADLRVGSTPR